MGLRAAAGEPGKALARGSGLGRVDMDGLSHRSRHQRDWAQCV